MKSLKEVSLADAHDIIDKWYEKGIVGNLILYRGPTSGTLGVVLEQVIKHREMTGTGQAAFENFCKKFPCQRGEFFKDASDKPDRIKVYRDLEDVEI